MAEQVHLHLEAKIPELKDLQEKGIFTDDELIHITKKRTKYEFRLKRRGAIIEDFLAYIEYEKMLEIKRKERVKNLSIKGKHSVSDHSIVQNIYGLYQRALVKFKSNVNLWLQFLEYAKLEGGKQVFTKSATKALQFHPHSEELWIIAASNEWHINGNMKAARNLFQKAIHLNGEKFEIWISFFQLEMDFIEKLSERRKILGIENDKSIDSDLLVFDGALAKIVFDHCITLNPKIPPRYLAKFLKISSMAKDALPSVFEHVISTLKNNFFLEAEYLLELIPTFIGSNCTLETLKESIKLLDSALEKNFCPSVIMSCIEVIRQISDVALIDQSEDINDAIRQKTESILQLAMENECVDDLLFLYWMDINSQNVEKLTKIYIDAREKYPVNDEIHLKYLCLLLNNCENILEIVILLKKHSRQFSLLSSASLSKSSDHLALKILSILKSSEDHDIDAILCSLTFIFSLSHVKIQKTFNEIPKFILNASNIESVRSFSKNLSSKKLVSFDFYLAWINAEILNGDVTAVRNLLIKSTCLYPKVTSLWQCYYDFEKTNRNLSQASIVLQNAQKSGLTIDQ